MFLQNHSCNSFKKFAMTNLIWECVDKSPLKIIINQTVMTSWCQNTYALTGSIGAGKTTVCKIFQRLGAYIINADVLARQAVEPNSEGIHEIVRCFGDKILNPDGTLNRGLMGKLIFSKPDLRTKLEEITHPIIHRLAEQEYLRIIDSNPGAVIYDVPLLFETQLHKVGFKAIIVVFASEEQCIDRLITNRKMDLEEAKKRYHCQIPIINKESLADYVIYNTGNLDLLESQVVMLYAKITSQN